MKNPLLVAIRNMAMRYTNIPGNDLKRIHEYDAEKWVNSFAKRG
jgi:hypothetical protein